MGIQDEQGGFTSDARLSPLRKASFWRKVAASFVRLWGLWLIGICLLILPPFFRENRPAIPVFEGEKKPVEKGPQEESLHELEQALQQQDNEAVLTFFKRRALSNDERKAVEQLLEQLADPRFHARAEAVEALEHQGPRVAGMLRRGVRHPDVEVADRCRQLLQRLLPRTRIALLTDGLRRIARSNSPELLPTLLAYLPDAETESLAQEVRRILSARIEEEGKPPAALVAALTDAQPERRLAAGLLLAPLKEHRAEVRTLLDDPFATVRYPVALALLARQEKAALPALIDLLPSLESAEAWTALDALSYNADVKGPAVAPGRGAAREHARQAWLAWWKREKDRIEPRGLPLNLPRGSTLLVQMELRSQRGEIVEIGPKGEIRPHSDNLEYPVWATVLRPDRQLVVEYLGDRVTERDDGGRILHTLHVKRPVYAERLPGGKTFVACRDALYEFDASGTPRDLARWPGRTVATARPCRNGQTLVLTEGGTCLFLDASGKESQRFETGCQLVLAPGIDVTANNRVLVPDHAGNRVVEFAPSSELLWQAEVVAPTSVQRLPDGNTLVASTTTREVIELDRLGRIVWRLPTTALRSSSRPVVAVRLPR